MENSLKVKCLELRANVTDIEKKYSNEFYLFVLIEVKSSQITFQNKF